jgi:hypothetical protein
VKKKIAEDTRKSVNKACEEESWEINKIHAGTKYSCDARNLTAYGGLPPVTALLKKLGFEAMTNETVK